VRGLLLSVTDRWSQLDASGSKIVLIVSIVTGTQS
jgi:hypothetical protein